MSISDLLRRRALATARVRRTPIHSSPITPTLSHSSIQRAMTNPHTLPATDLLHLQRMVGNQQISRMLQQGQSAKQGSGLRVGASDDHFERTAEKMAAQVSQGDSGAVQRALAEEDEGGVVSGSLQRRIEQARSGGSPAPEAVRRKMEAHTGADFSDVRVHHNQESDVISDELGAKAATHGKDIFLARNQSPHDVQLMAHELTHTIQQRAVKGGMLCKPAAKQFNTVQREPDEKKIKKLKAKRFLAKLGSGAAKLLDTLVTLPFQVIDQLSVLDLQAKDFKNWVKHVKKTGKFSNKDKYISPYSQAKRKLGRTGLSGYMRGQQSHVLTYGVEPIGRSPTTLPWYSYLNPFAIGAKLGGNASKKVNSYNDSIRKIRTPQQTSMEVNRQEKELSKRMNRQEDIENKSKNLVPQDNTQTGEIGGIPEPSLDNVEQNDNNDSQEGFMVLDQILSQLIEEDQQKKN